MSHLPWIVDVTTLVALTGGLLWAGASRPRPAKVRVRAPRRR